MITLQMGFFSLSYVSWYETFLTVQVYLFCDFCSITYGCWLWFPSKQNFKMHVSMV